MTASLLVLAPGLAATLQDMGRTGYQALGVPVSGALDADALQIANWVVGNGGGEGAVEMRFSGPSFEVHGAAARVAVAGSGAEIRFGPSNNDFSPAFRSTTFAPGQRFRIALRGGAACYLAVEGGFDVTPELGSVSTLTLAGLGGFSGRALAKGDRLPLRCAPAAGSSERVMRSPTLGVPERLRVILGPQDDHFTPASIAAFLTQGYTVSAASNRVGLRLEGEPLRHARSADIISDGTVLGAIQVPGSGQPIILMPDRGTTGGYPKIATVISADRAALGRIAPGATVCFQAVSHEEAVSALRAHKAWLTGLKNGIRPWRDAEAALTEALWQENIISGVTDAQS